jgi:hypothetical protein
METLKIGMSGKRKYAESYEYLKWEIIKSIDEILKCHKTKTFIGYSSLAIGADTVFARVVKEYYKMRLVAVLPMPADVYILRYEDADKDVFLEMLGIADEQREMPVSTAAGEQMPMDKLYLAAGKKIVDECDEMVFVWDKLMPKGIGGTGHIMGYYMEKKKQLPVEYIKVSPDEEAQKSGKVRLHQEMSDQFDRANAEARSNKKAYRLSWILSILFSWLAVVLFAVNVSFHKHIIEEAQLVLSAIELLLVVSVYLLVARAKKKGFHSAYLVQRLHAEAIRLLKRSFQTRFNISIIELQATDKVEDAQPQTNHKTKIEELQHTLKAGMAGLIQRMRPYTTDANESALYTGFAIKRLINKQLTYHQSRVDAIGERHERWECANRIIAMLFLINLVSHFVLSVLHNYHVIPHVPFMHEATTMLTIVFPASYAAIEGVLYFNEWHRIKEHSTDAIKELKKIMEEMPALATMENDLKVALLHQSVALYKTAGIMLYENKSWHLVLQDKYNYRQMA